MCQFKSGIILKTRCVIAQGNNDSHRNLLEELHIKDTVENALRMFVRAELVPQKNEWWTDPDTWELHIDQDITPEWFDLDRDKYIQCFRAVVKEWWQKHVFVDKKIKELTIGYYRLKRCEVKRLLEEAQVMCDSSTVQEMYGSSTVQEMYGSSTVQRMYGRSTVQEMHDNSTVQRMHDRSTVQEMHDNSTVQRMCDRSTVQGMYGSSTVQRMYGSSTVQRMHDNSTVQRMCDRSTVQGMYGSSTVQRMYGSSTVQGMYGRSTVQEMHDNSIIARDQNNNIHTAAYSPAEIIRHGNQEKEVQPDA